MRGGDVGSWYWGSLIILADRSAGKAASSSIANWAVVDDVVEVGVVAVGVSSMMIGLWLLAAIRSGVAANASSVIFGEDEINTWANSGDDAGGCGSVVALRTCR